MRIPIIGDLLAKLGHPAFSPSTEVGDTTDPTTGRPEPLLGLANIWGLAHGIAAAGITAATTLGVLSAKNSQTVNKGLGAADLLVTAIATGVAGLAPVLASHSVATIGRELVTPLVDPQSS